MRGIVSQVTWTDHILSAVAGGYTIRAVWMRRMILAVAATECTQPASRILEDLKPAGSARSSERRGQEGEQERKYGRGRENGVDSKPRIPPGQSAADSRTGDVAKAAWTEPEGWRWFIATTEYLVSNALFPVAEESRNW